MRRTPSHTLMGLRLPARDIIEAVVGNMRQNLEPLKYSTLAPSRYIVYLHPAEYARLEGIMPILQEQTIRALTDELSKLNTRPRFARLVPWTKSESSAEVRSAASDWQIEFLPDADGEMSEGDLYIDSELVLPASADLGLGERTRKITTVHSGSRTATLERTNPHAPALAPAPLARIDYDDDSGRHSYEVVKESFTIGRGGIAYPVDLRIATSPDVSREHARIRKDSRSNRFFLIDLSSLGTTLNGRHVPRGYDEVDGARRENGAETALPDVARIGLADTVFLEFRHIR